MSSIRDRLKKAKGNRRWDDIGRDAGISQRALERLLYEEAGVRNKRGPTLDTVQALAKACGVAPGWLAFGGDDDGRS